MIILYTPPPSAIVPVAPAVTRREATYRKHKRSWWMPVDYDSQCLMHKRLLQSGWKPARWEVVA